MVPLSAKSAQLRTVLLNAHKPFTLATETIFHYLIHIELSSTLFVCEWPIITTDHRHGRFSQSLPPNLTLLSVLLDLLGIVVDHFLRPIEISLTI